MSPFSTFVALLPILSTTSAFPSLYLDGRQVALPFDAAQQYVSNQGEHKFIAGGPNDSRSPCPALNVMANHGYIPRNGSVTLVQMEQGLMQTYGLSPDLASVLTLILLGATRNGDVYQIGGFQSSLAGVTPYQFIQTYDIGTIQATDPMAQICTNYKAINGAQYHTSDPFSSGGAGNDELFFRVFGNKSADYPLGTLDGPTKLSMLTMIPKTDGSGTFTWNKFHNAIPDNWYKYNALTPFTTALFVVDILEISALGCAPDFSPFFASTDISALTFGAYTNKDLQDSNTAMCFLTQAAPLVLPALANQAVFDANTRQNVATAVNSIQKQSQGLTCSTVMKSINLALLGNILGLQL